MTISSNFLFTETLDGNHRLRIKNGKLIYEDISIRKNSNCLYRLITRKQYSQSAILNKMTRLHQQAEKDNSWTKEFINNYRFLVNKATVQNQRYENTFCFFRFLKGKTHINVTSHKNLIDDVIFFPSFKSLPKESSPTESSKDTESANDPLSPDVVNPLPDSNKNAPPLKEEWELPPGDWLESEHKVTDGEKKAHEEWELPPGDWLNTIHKIPGSDLIPDEDAVWWDQEDEPDETVILSANFANLSINFSSDLLKLINPKLSIEQKDNSAKLIGELFILIGLETISEFISKDLKSRKDFNDYLKKNSVEFTDKILNNYNFITK